jgi:hypothetical protein
MKCSSKVKTKILSFAAFFSIHFEPRFEPFGWLRALYSSAAGRKNRSRDSSAAIPMTKIRAEVGAAHSTTHSAHFRACVLHAGTSWVSNL